MRKTKRRRRGSGTAGIMIIVLAFLVVMTVQICRIRSKDAEYAAKEKELQQQYEEETERSTEIDDLETYILSEVQAICNDIKMIDSGHLVFSGSMEDFDNYIAPDSFIIELNHSPGKEVLAGLAPNKGIEELSENRFRIFFSGDNSITEQYIERSVTGNWDLKELLVERCSLDRIFAQLSGKIKE